MARNNEHVVKALLAKAENAGFNSPEGIACQEKAFKLMARWGIEEAAVFQKDPESDILISKKISFVAPHATIKRTLYATLVKNHRGHMVITPKGSCHVFIYASDLKTVEFLFTILMNNGISELNRTPVIGNTRSFNHSFWMGYIVAISSRLKAANKSEEDKEPGAALVLYDKAKATANEMNATYSRLGKMQGPKATNYNGFSAGKIAGSRANFGDAEVSNNRKEIT